MKPKTLFFWIAVIAIVFVLPTGDVSDVLVFSLITEIGVSSYILLAGVVLFFAWHCIDGNGVSGKLKSVKSHIKGVMK